MPLAADDRSRSRRTSFRPSASKKETRQLKQGDPTRTTLYNLGYPNGYYPYGYGSNFDLQSAPAKRIVASGSAYSSSSNPTIYDSAIFYFDMGSPGCPVTAIDCDPAHTLHNAGLTSYKYPFAQCIYQSNNVQPVKVGPKQ